MKGIGLLRKLQSVLTQTPLLTICKSFVRPHLNCGRAVMISLQMMLFLTNWKLFNAMQL